MESTIDLANNSLMGSVILLYSKLAVDVIIPLIILLFVFGLVLLLKRHYLIRRENHFAQNVNQYAQSMATVHLSGSGNFYSHLKHVLFQAMEDCTTYMKLPENRLTWLRKRTKSADWKRDMPNLAGSDLALIATLRLTARINKSIGVDLLVHAGEADRLLSEIEKSSSIRSSFANFLDKTCNISQGYRQIVSALLEYANYVDFQQYKQPDFSSIVVFSTINNKVFRRVFTGISFETANSLLRSWHEIMIILGILGTFLGFFISFSEHGSLETGIAMAITSSIVGLTLGVIFLLLEKSFPDDEVTDNTLSLLEDSMDQIWNVTTWKDTRVTTP